MYESEHEATNKKFLKLLERKFKDNICKISSCLHFCKGASPRFCTKPCNW